MLPNKINLFGFSLSRTMFAVLLAGVLIMIFKLYQFLNVIYQKVKSFLGLGDKESSVTNQEEIQKILKKDPAVQSQMTTGNLMKADDLYNAMASMPYDIDRIYKIFGTITGINQMKAVSLAYGIRSFHPWPFTTTGSLATCLKSRLWGYQLDKNVAPDGYKWSINSRLNELYK